MPIASLGQPAGWLPSLDQPTSLVVTTVFVAMLLVAIGMEHWLATTGPGALLRGEQHGLAAAMTSTGSAVESEGFDEVQSDQAGQSLGHNARSEEHTSELQSR